MKDCENIKFCGTHGIELDDNNCCTKCAERNKKEYEECEDGDWKEKVLKYNLKGSWEWYEQHFKDKSIGEKDFYKKYIRETGNTSGYFCDNCSLIQWHHLQYCPKCNGKFSRREMSKQEFGEKYSNYRVGY